MSNLGMRIDDGKLEAGFVAATREEFDSYIDRLQMIAATIWTPEAPKVQSAVNAAGATGNYAEDRKATAAQPDNWREIHGLR